MNLVFIENDVPVTDSLTVAQVFGKDHRNVMADIENQISKLVEAGESEWGVLNFQRTQYQHPQNKQWYSKFNMTEEAFAIVAMSYVTPAAMKMKIRFLDEFKRLKLKLVSEHHNIPQNYVEALYLAANLEKARVELEEKNSQLVQQIEQDKPLVIFAESVQVSDDSILVRDMAKLLKQNGVDIGEQRMFQYLRENGYLIKGGSDYNMPTQKSMNLGIMEVKTGTRNGSNGVIRITRTPKITGKGQIYFINKFLNKLPQVIGGQHE